MRTPGEMVAGIRQLPDDPGIRAQMLLDEHLDKDQRQTLSTHGWFDVVSSIGRKWRLWGVGTAVCLENRNMYCTTITRGYYPRPDAVLARKLLLETDEGEFMSIACLQGRAGAIL